MSRSIEVVAYSGYRGEQEPRAVVIGGERRPVLRIRRRWIAPDGRYFDVEMAGGERLVLRCAPPGSTGEDSEDLAWSIASS